MRKVMSPSESRLTAHFVFSASLQLYSCTVRGYYNTIISDYGLYQCVQRIPNYTTLTVLRYLFIEEFATCTQYIRSSTESRAGILVLV